MALQFTDQDKVDVRRHLGYGALGDLSQGNSLMYWRFFYAFNSLEYRLNHMTDDEIAVVQGQYLPQLNQLETDVYSARSNLDTSKAAVWSHNDAEIPDRIELFNYFRKQLCAFFQLPPGPFFVHSASAGMRFVN